MGLRGQPDVWLWSATHIVLVYGPPGAGKTTHVQNTRAPGDIVIDYDRIAQALGSDVSHHHPDPIHHAALAARNALLVALRKGQLPAERAWIVSAHPHAPAMFPHHEAVLIDPGRDEVLAQATAAGRPDDWSTLVDDWYAATAGVPSRSW